MSAWLTTANQDVLLKCRGDYRWGAGTHSGLSELHVSQDQAHQAMQGFGFSLTGGSAQLISQLPREKRAPLLQELFSADGEEDIGVGILRLSIGASDLSERRFSYDDMPAGEEDFELSRFDIAAGDPEVIPLLQEILAINPALRIIATPWSAPPWMKTNQSFVGGKLRPECHPAYAAYFVNYLRAMRENGIVIHAVTPQNEPLNHKNDPSMVMEVEEQTAFIRDHLGPALRAAGLAGVEIFCWDHNCDRPDYPLAVFADAEARRYLAGSAWHLYGGDISALSQVHQAYPGMKLYFTEQWVGSDGAFGPDLMWHVRHVLIGATRNWSRVVLEWNLASDPDCRPHTPGGESRCVGALTIDGDQVTRNVAYYVIAHAAKFVRPGSVRIHSDDWADLPNVAFRTPDGQIVLIALNDSPAPQSFNIVYQGQRTAVSLPGLAVATYVWQAE